ncbi:MAG: 3-beta hydroxysteroid dehydrogenase [Caproiciproducens sp.]|nr:3-beta hydroxysteroid dehydrogenase [Caproiciproducens sp.]
MGASIQLFLHAKEGAVMLRMSRNVRNEKSKKILGWKPIANNEEAVLASVSSMIEFRIIKEGAKI